MDLNNRPRLTVILPAMLGYESVSAAIAAWEAQTRRDLFELLVCCPSAPAGLRIPDGQRVLATGSRMLHQLRAHAIAEARTEWVMIAEDHCVPDADLVARMVAVCDSGEWDVVAPALRSGNPGSAWTQASFLLGYGQWMAPVDSGTARHVPGHNVLVSRKVLAGLGHELERLLLISAFLMQRLARDGRRMAMVGAAGMRHFDPTGTRGLPIFFTVGLGFGAVRTEPMPELARILYPLAAPLVAALHWRRALRHYLRAGAAAGLKMSCLGAAALLACCWAAGEAVGAWRGVASVTPELWRSEVKPLTPAMLTESDRAAAAQTAAESSPVSRS